MAKRIKWDDKASAASNARAHLPAMLLSYYEEGRALAGNALAADRLHQFRLATKRLRYTVELFRACYGPGLERWLAGMREIQDHLGAISDCASTRDLVLAKLPKESAERTRIERALAARARREAAAFRRYWRTAFDAPGESRRWAAYFGRGRYS
jgi:CHAD domain-containing protein